MERERRMIRKKKDIKEGKAEEKKMIGLVVGKFCRVQDHREENKRENR